MLFGLREETIKDFTRESRNVTHKTNKIEKNQLKTRYLCVCVCGYASNNVLNCFLRDCVSMRLLVLPCSLLVLLLLLTCLGLAGLPRRGFSPFGGIIRPLDLVFQIGKGTDVMIRCGSITLKENGSTKRRMERKIAGGK